MSRKKRNPYFIFTLLFILIAVVIFFPFYRRGISLVWMGDGYDQYYPALAYIGQYGREFLTTFFKGQIREFDFSIGMGDDVIGTLSYYGMGDPLNWLAIFVQPKNIAYLYSALLVFRWYLGGIAFIWFVKRKGNGNFGAVVGALA